MAKKTRRQKIASYQRRLNRLKSNYGNFNLVEKTVVPVVPINLPKELFLVDKKTIVLNVDQKAIVHDLLRVTLLTSMMIAVELLIYTHLK